MVLVMVVGDGCVGDEIQYARMRRAEACLVGE